MILFFKIRLTYGYKVKVNEIKGKLILEGIIPPYTTSLTLGSLQRNVAIVIAISFICLSTLGKIWIQFLEITCGKDEKS